MTATDHRANALPLPTDSRGSVTPKSVRAFLGRPNGLIAFVIYAAASMLWYRSAVRHMGSSCGCSLPGDSAQVVWALEWFPHALFHGLNLLDTKAIWSPSGLNLAGVTAAPLIAFLAAPVTSIWGPIVSYNVVTLAAPTLGAWSGYWLCRHITKSQWASIIAGATYGFGTFEIAQNNGHVQMSVTVVPALLALCVLRFTGSQSSRKRFLLEATVLLVAQMFIGTEMLFTMTVLGAVALALAWMLSPQDARQRIVSAALVLAVAYLIMAVLSSWYVVELLRSPSYSKYWGLDYYPTDALGFLLPMPYTWIGGGIFAPVTATYFGGLAETNAYLGLPLILTVLRFLCTRWSQRAVKLLTGLLVVSILWVLGAHLYVAGKPTIWLPYSLFAHLPGFNELMQGRVALYVELACAVILAMWLATPSKRAALRWICGLLALLFVIPNFVHPNWYNNGVWTNPTFFKTDMYKRYLRRGENIMPISWGQMSESPVWQAEDHFYYNMASGYWLPSPPASWLNKLTEDLWANTPHAADIPLLRPFIVARDVSDVVVQPSFVAGWAPILRAAGLHRTATAGGVVIYHVPSSWLSKAVSRRT